MRIAERQTIAPRQGRGIGGAAAAPARQATRGPQREAAPGSTGCACGGGCPRCSAVSPAAQALPLSQPGDAAEREADSLAREAQQRPLRAGGRIEQARTPPAAPAGLPAAGQALDAPLRRDMEARFGHGFAAVRVHTDAQAQRSALALNAKAYTVGADIVFAPGQFAPHSEGGRALLAHELAHVTQQQRSGRAAVQREVINMEPLRVTSTLRPTGDSVSGLDQLRGQGAGSGGITMAHADADIARNAPDPARRLPFSGGSWDASAILNVLGQYDTLPGTDSDAVRCVQAVAMAARIPDGPGAVVGFLQSMILEGMMAGGAARQATAVRVLEHVVGRIQTERATFGDLSWAQEALHDLFYNDVSGTPLPDIRNRLGPALEMGMSMQRMDVWCNSPAEVLAQVQLLQPGEKLMVNTWTVVFNTAFEDLEEQGIHVAPGAWQWVEVNGRRVRIRQIDTTTRPAHGAIDAVRDTRNGHQLLVFKETGATGALRLYEPEITNSGTHLETLASDGSNFSRYFRDQPEYGIYHYIEILGKLVPARTASAWPAAGP